MIQITEIIGMKSNFNTQQIKIFSFILLNSRRTKQKKNMQVYTF
jgi:hypothetical protein